MKSFLCPVKSEKRNVYSFCIKISVLVLVRINGKNHYFLLYSMPHINLNNTKIILKKISIWAIE